MKTRSICLALAVAAAVPGFARADDKRRLGGDDVEYARALRESGFTDLAAEIIAALKRTSKTGGAESELYDIDSKLDEADDPRIDPKKKKDLLLEGLRLKEKYAESHKGTEPGDRAAAELPDLYRRVGDAIAEVVRKETDTAAAEALSKEGRGIFERAEKALTTKRDAKKREAADAAEDDKEEEAEKANNECSIAWFDLIRTRYFHSKLVSDAVEREKLLRQTIVEMDEFELDLGDQLGFFESWVYVGLCQKDLGDTKKALAAFDETIKLRSKIGQKDKATGVWQFDEDLRSIVPDVVSGAVLQKVLLQTSMKDTAGAVATANDFLTTMPSALNAAQGKAVLAAQADAFAAAGDFASVEATARKLIAADPDGPWGNRGRIILAEMGGSRGGLRPEELLATATTSLAKNELQQATEMCHRALAAVRAGAPNPTLGADVCNLLGTVYNQRGWLHDAIVVWDAGSEEFAAGERAPEILWKSISGWMLLAGQEKRPAYATIGRERMQLLAKRYPKHPYASMAQVVEGQRLEAAGDNVAAADAYEKVDPSSAAYPEAIFRAGNVLQKETWRLSLLKQNDKAKAISVRAEANLRKAMTLLASAAEKSLDETVKARSGGLAFGAKMALANLFLCEAVGRAADVAAVLDGAEKDAGTDAKRLGAIWEFRFKALQQQGKLDDAKKMFEEQFSKDPKSPTLQAGAYALASALDRQAFEALGKDAKSAKGLADARAAAKYYDMWLNAYLRGEQSADASDVEIIASRLYVIGLLINGVPEGVESFADWRSELKEPGVLRSAAKAYGAVAASTQSYRTLLLAARTSGFLKEWRAAAEAYAQVFEREKIVMENPGGGPKRFDQTAIRAKQELVPAWIEWGIVERETAIATNNDSARLARAFGIFETLAASVANDTKLWWTAKYWQCRLQADKGAYEDAMFSVNGLERTSDHFDNNRFGFQPLFEALKAELKPKVVQK